MRVYGKYHSKCFIHFIVHKQLKMLLDVDLHLHSSQTFYPKQMILLPLLLLGVLLEPFDLNAFPDGTSLGQVPSALEQDPSCWP